MFTRSLAALLSGMSEEQIKNFSRSDRSPSFFHPESDGRERRWTRYSARDVVMIALTERLRMTIGYADGLRPDTAAKIAAHAVLAVDDALRSAEPIWAGYVGTPLDHTDRGYRESSLGGFNVAGSLVEVAEKVAADASSLRLFVVNVSEVIEEVRRRAAEHDIPFVIEASVN